MKMFLLYAMSLTASMALYHVLSNTSKTLDAPILAITQAQAAGQPVPAMPLAQAQKLAAQYQARAAQIERAEGVTP